MSIGNVVSTLVEARILTRLKRELAPRPLDTCDSIAARMEDTAARHPNAEAIVFEGQSLTWSQLNQSVNRVAAALATRGLSTGDSVCLMMENRIEFATCLMALNKLGLIAALINTNLTGKSLTHCIGITNSRFCIFGEERLSAIEEIKDLPDLASVEGYLYVADSGSQGSPEWASDLGAEAAQASTNNPVETKTQTLAETALYIYTSGTTGFPKASVVSNRRLLISASLGYIGGLKATVKDRIYLCLPLYHGTGLFFGLATACCSGATLILRRKFSGSSFLSDVREHRATCFVYIGELCRYLLNTEQAADDHLTPLVKIMGNGLRPDVWHEFKKRFGIKRVAEFYGSSEGNIAFVNLLNKDCTVGTTTLPLALIEYDVFNDVITRDDAGHCIAVAAEKPGLLLGQITEFTIFEGYTNKEATESKILRDVFEPGDAWFNTGDLMKTVDVGFSLGFTHYQFVDRVGDTFRWKSENVSTNEVGEVINGHPQVDFCNVYGVEIPGTDGRAGMVSLILSEGVGELDLTSFSQYVNAQLPHYARPVFLRVQPEMDTTGTFKMVKGDLRKEGYDQSLISDPVLVMKPRAEQYEALDASFAELIGSGKAGY